MKHIICAFLFIFMISNNAFADEKEVYDPIVTFLEKTKSKQNFCIFLEEMTIFESNLPRGMVKNTKERQSTSECTNDAIESIKEEYKKAIEVTKKNEKIYSMIKDYYAFWLTSMRTIPISISDLNNKNKYQERVAKDQAKISEMGERIKLELEL